MKSFINDFLLYFARSWILLNIICFPIIFEESYIYYRYCIGLLSVIIFFVCFVSQLSISLFQKTRESDNTEQGVLK